ncbi:hypothetical protein [Luteitalea sp.]
MSTPLLDQAVPLLATVRAEIVRLSALEAALTAFLPSATAAATDDGHIHAAMSVSPVIVPATDEPFLEAQRVEVQPPAQVVTPGTTERLGERASAGPYSAKERREMVLGLLRQRGSLRVRELAALMEEAQNRVQDALDRLSREGHVTRVGPGEYAAVVVQWNGAMKQPLVDRETSAFAQRPE